CGSRRSSFVRETSAVHLGASRHNNLFSTVFGALIIFDVAKPNDAVISVNADTYRPPCYFTPRAFIDNYRVVTRAALPSGQSFFRCGAPRTVIGDFITIALITRDLARLIPH